MVGMKWRKRKKMAKNIVIGIGNLLFYDDGVGIIAIDYLKQNFSFEPEIELLDGGTLGFNLLEYFLEYDNVLIIDTISTDDKAGEIYKIPSTELLGQGQYKNTAHEVEVVSMLEACELYGKKANITIFGIVPENITTVKIGLSDTLKNKFKILIQTILKEIQDLEINVIEKNSISLTEILEELK